MLCFCSREPHHDRTLSVVKAKCFRVICKEVDKAINDDVARARGGIVSVTFHDDVFLGLNFCFATRASGEEVGEESLSVFSDGGVAGGHVGEASAKRVSKSYDRECEGD